MHVCVKWHNLPPSLGTPRPTRTPLLGLLGCRGLPRGLRISFTRAPVSCAAGAVGAEGAPVKNHPLFRLPAHGFQRELVRAQRYWNPSKRICAQVNVHVFG